MDLPKIDISFPLTEGDEGHDVEMITFDNGVSIAVLQGGLITHQINLTKELELTVEIFGKREVLYKKSLKGEF